jgi:hypothetical protein
MSAYDEDEKGEIMDAYDALANAADGRVPYAILEAACMLVGELMAITFDEVDLPKNKGFAMVMERIERSYVLHKMEGRKQ